MNKVADNSDKTDFKASLRSSFLSQEKFLPLQESCGASVNANTLTSDLAPFMSRKNMDLNLFYITQENRKTAYINNYEEPVLDVMSEYILEEPSSLYSKSFSNDWIKLLNDVVFLKNMFRHIF